MAKDKKELLQDPIQISKDRIRTIDSKLSDLAVILHDTVDQIRKLTEERSLLEGRLHGSSVRNIESIFFDEIIDQGCMKRINEFLRKYLPEGR